MREGKRRGSPRFKGTGEEKSRTFPPRSFIKKGKKKRNPLFLLRKEEKGPAKKKTFTKGKKGGKSTFLIAVPKKEIISLRKRGKKEEKGGVV